MHNHHIKLTVIGGFGKMAQAISHYVETTKTLHNTNKTNISIQIKYQVCLGRNLQSNYLNNTHKNNNKTTFLSGITPLKSNSPLNNTIPKQWANYIQSHKNKQLVFQHYDNSTNRVHSIPPEPTKHNLENPHTDSSPEYLFYILLGNVQYILNPNKPITLEHALKDSDVVIDFSSPQSTINTLEINTTYKKPIIIGTTGFTQEQRTKIARFSTLYPIVLDANFSIGMNTFFHAIKKLAPILNTHNFSIDIHETHHKHKKDAPSGTALKIAQLSTPTNQYTNTNITTYQEKMHTIKPHQKPHTRNTQDLGITYQRRGQIIGEHTVTFTSNTEIIELSHKALDREAFAQGAVHAATWAYRSRFSSGLYEMENILNFHLNSRNHKV